MNQAEVEKEKKEQKRNKNKEHEDKAKNKKITCFTCGQEGHIAPKCPNKDAPVVDRLPDPAAENAPKVVKYKDKCKFLCTKCKRYTATHGTEQHTMPKKEKPKEEKTNVPTNSTEANTFAYDGVPAWVPWSA
jgi:Zinc knuckle